MLLRDPAKAMLRTAAVLKAQLRWKATHCWCIYLDKLVVFSSNCIQQPWCQSQKAGKQNQAKVSAAQEIKNNLGESQKMKGTGFIWTTTEGMPGGKDATPERHRNPREEWTSTHVPSERVRQSLVWYDCFIVHICKSKSIDLESRLWFASGWAERD